MDDLIKEFLEEARENLDRVEQDLMALEKTPNSRELIGSIFRSVHTIKGNSGFLALSKLESVAHAGEDLLSRLREGKLTLNAEIADALLLLVDALRHMLNCLQETAKETNQDFSELVARLRRLEAGESVGAPAAAVKPAEAPAAEPIPTPVTAPAKVAAPDETAGHEVTNTAAEGNVRVGVGLLDKLMNLVGELVLARNQILQLNSDRDGVAFAAAQRLNLVTTELQEEVMKTRLQPVGNVWTKFPRIVRDLSQEMGKQVRLTMEGQNTELDRTIIEAIKDPLTHLIRNSVDHGIETPEQRRAAGKSETGSLCLHAYHEGGQVNIEIRDDGRGIDVERVKTKAIGKGLITAEQAARLTEREAFQLIFLAGLSTADKVTSVSGRGVGMDVVKTNIEKIGGSVDVASELGLGTTIKLKIPLTLAIIPALMVSSGGERYAIPQVSLVELVRLEGEQARRGVEKVMGAPVYRLRGNLLPLVQLSQVLRQTAATTSESEPVNIVVLQADQHQFGLVVDHINDTQEIVVKPLGKHLKGIPVFAGATILGDGRVSLILDVLGLAQSAQVAVGSHERKAAQAAEADATRDERQRLLLFSVGEGRQLAIDLATVGRLEQVPRQKVERAGNQEVVQYRGRIMKLLRLSDCLSYSGDQQAEGENMQVVVYSELGRSVGLVVGQILDIVEENLQLQSDDGRPGVRGKAIIQGRVTEVLDVPGMVRQYNPEFAAEAVSN